MIQYYELTDSLRNGEIIREEGRKHFRFSFGDFQWTRTTLFQAYITEGTPEYKMYRPLSEDRAQALLIQRGKEISRMMKKAQEIAQQAHMYQTDRAGNPYVEHISAVVDGLTDWEERTVAWLQKVCSCSGWSIERLRKEGFSERICNSVELLIYHSDESYSDYLTKVRKDRIARHVKIAALANMIDTASLSSLSEEDRERVENYREARKYLFGDISELPITCHNIESADCPQNQIVPAERIYQMIYPLALGGRKIPHGVSNPVLYYTEKQLFLAFFVYTYSRAQLQQGVIGRPSSWILADVRTGQLIKEISCNQKDFSPAGRNELFSVKNPNAPTDKDFFCNTYALLDKVREEYLTTNTLNMALYEQYLDQVFLAVPPSYHRFYRELSNP